jgi:GTPase Era involved in 16S rRNA processing
MSDILLTPKLEPALTRLKSIWPWGRKLLIEQLQQHITAADEHALRMQALRQSIEAELARVNAELARAESDHDTLQESHQHLQLEYETLGNTADMIESRYNLVCNILNSKPTENPALRELKGWLAGEFARDVQRLELPADVTSPALEQAQAIGLHVELLSDSPALRTKFLVAVAGGFSSGKSSFVTSFMRKDYSQLLAKGIQPVTAIPTYVMPGSELSIYGHTSKGAHVELSKDEYAQLTHDFIAKMGFSVKEIMPHVVIESPMPALNHLAFIDMPGYDPAASDTADTAADNGIASAALSEADAVIWLVALDSNGTLPANDLEFLLQHADDRPLFVVLNKADLRPLANLEAVIEEIKEHLEDSGIQFEGICAYSSTLGKELLHYGRSLNDIMQEWDNLSDAALMLHKEFDALVTELKKHSGQQLDKVEMIDRLAHSLELDILQIAGFESSVFQTAKSRIKELKKLTKSVFSTERSEISQTLENIRLCGHKLLQENLEQVTANSQRNEAFME